MPIYSDDLKIKKSAVMADVPEGGGAMTGADVLDGSTDQFFNDISADNHANGAFHLRKGFAVAHTDDASILLGGGWVILKPPADGNVDVTCFETPGWFDERTDALSLVESYLVKGPRLLCRIQDTHYAGTGVLQLYDVGAAMSFPASGDSIVMRNPSGTEQRVRALKVTITRDVVVYDDAGAYTVNLASCELNSPLTFDLLGKPPQRVAPSSTTTATVFTTVPAAGAKFHGVKPLKNAITLGGSAIRKVTVDGGIFAQLVPATTQDTPIVDLYPLVQRPALSRTATATVSLTTASVALAPGAVLKLPTAIEPATLTMAHGATAFTTNAAGDLLQGSTVVGVADWINKTITMLGSAPNYGTASNTLTYKPATVNGATVHSISHEVTEANQSTALVQVLEPPPAPGTVSLSYMAQGTWYELTDDGSGKLSGGDSSYGAGTVSFVTGSVAITMGALPDVGSTVILAWGEAASARIATGLPTRAFTEVTLPERHLPGSISISWPRGGSTYTATVSAAGVVTGPAQVGRVELQADGITEVFRFSPDTLPDGNVTVTYQSLASVGGFTNAGGGSYTLTGAPLAPGSLRFKVTGTDATASGGAVARSFDAYSVGTEVFINGTLIGSVNNSTGALVLNGAATVQDVRWVDVRVGRAQSGVYTGASYFTTDYIKRTEEFLEFALAVGSILEFAYQPATGSAADSVTVTPSWRIDLDPPEGLEAVTTGAVFTWAGAVHFTAAGVAYQGWNSATGASASVGAATSGGLITLGAIAPGASNAIAWVNAALDARGGLDVLGGVFRVASAPIKAGIFQLQVGSLVGNSNSGGIISGDFVGIVDAQRGVVRWTVNDLLTDDPVRADDLTYNAVFLQYVPLDTALLGVDTTGLPIDGRVPIYRAGGDVVVHNTQTFTFPNPLTKGTAYDLGRQRLSSVVLRDAVGTRIPSNLFAYDRNLGACSVLVAADISVYAEPFTADHRVQDELQVIKADISGEITFAGALSHDYPVPGSYASSKLRQGDKFARVHSVLDRATWAGSYDATVAGSNTSASFNTIDYPITVTNRGAIKERWWAVFRNTTNVDIYGEHVGQVLSNQPIASVLEAINPQTSVPYWSIPSAGWGGGFPQGSVLLWETEAAGGAGWFARSVLPGATAVLDDSATLGYIANVDTP